MTLREIIEQEIENVRRELKEHTSRHSDYGRAYWDGNIDALKWVLKQMEISKEFKTLFSQEDIREREVRSEW